MTALDDAVAAHNAAVQHVGCLVNASRYTDSAVYSMNGSPIPVPMPVQDAMRVAQRELTRAVYVAERTAADLAKEVRALWLADNPS